MRSLFINSFIFCYMFVFASAVSLRAQSAQTAPTASPTTRKIRVLILDGFSNHNWRLNTKLLRGLLQPTGLFDVSVSTCPANDAPDWAVWKPDFDHTDVVVQTCNDISQPTHPKWPDPVKVAFVDFVSKGGGVLIYHSANNAFPGWTEYNDIIGLGWRPVSYGTALKMSADGSITPLPPGTGRATSHAPRADVLVHTLGEHPIHAGMPATWKTPLCEIYYDARGPAKNVQVLSYGQDPRFKDYWPLEWTVTYGSGRVYASSLGHVWSDESATTQPVDLLAIDEQILIQRAIQWLARRDVTIAIPANFPTADHTSLSGNIPVPAD